MSYQAQPIPISINYQGVMSGSQTALVSARFPNHQNDTLLRAESDSLSGLARVVGSVVMTRATALGYHGQPELVAMSPMPHNDKRKFLKRLGQNGVDTGQLERIVSESPRIEPTLVPVYASAEPYRS